MLGSRRRHRRDLTDNLLTQRKQARRTGNLQQRQLGLQLRPHPVRKLDRAEGVEPIGHQRLGRLQRLLQAQRLCKLLIHQLDRGGPGALKQEEGLDVLGAVGPAFGAAADEEAGEARVAEEVRLGGLGDGDPGDELGGARGVDGRGEAGGLLVLLEDGVREDFAEDGLVDAGPLFLVKVLLHAALFAT